MDVPKRVSLREYLSVISIKFLLEAQNTNLKTNMSKGIDVASQ